MQEHGMERCWKVGSLAQPWQQDVTPPTPCGSFSQRHQSQHVAPLSSHAGSKIPASRSCPTLTLPIETLPYPSVPTTVFLLVGTTV